jgi:hypothetical protein
VSSLLNINHVTVEIQLRGLIFVVAILAQQTVAHRLSNAALRPALSDSLLSNDHSGAEFRDKLARFGASIEWKDGGPGLAARNRQVPHWDNGPIIAVLIGQARQTSRTM